MVEFLSVNGARPDQIADAEVIFSELLGNAVRYAPGTVEVRVDWNRGYPVLHVIDEGPGFTYLPRLPRDAYAEAGRGLFLVSALTEDFHVSRRHVMGSHARAVLFPLAVRDRRSETHAPLTRVI
jgi:anti-sigma regulatory factor (Ser/Thr protein kinase)